MKNCLITVMALALTVSLPQTSQCLANQSALNSGNLTWHLFWNPYPETTRPDPSNEYGDSDDSPGDGFDSYSGSGGYEQSYWLIYVLRYLIVLESGSFRLESNPVAVPLVIAFHSLSGVRFSEDSILNQAYAVNETPVGDPVFLFCEPMDGNGKEGASGSDGKGASGSDGVGASGSDGAGGQQEGQEQNAENRDDGDNPDEPQNTKKVKVDVIALSKQLHEAIYNKDYNTVESLLDQGADPNEPYAHPKYANIDWRRTSEYPIMVSIHFKYGNIEICKLLLSRGANPNISSGNKLFDPPLRRLEAFVELDEATVDDVAPFADILLEYGADCLRGGKISTDFFRVLLNYAWDGYPQLRLKALNQIKEKGVDLNEYELDDGYVTIEYICRRFNRCSPSFIKLLIKDGLNINETPRGYSPLAWILGDCYCYTGICNTAKDISTAAKGIRTAVSIIKLFLDQGADCLQFDGEEAALSVMYFTSAFWDNHPNIRMTAFKQMNGLDINTLTVYKQHTNDGRDVRELKSRHWLIFMLGSGIEFSRKGVCFLISQGLIPDLTDREIEYGSAANKGTYEYTDNTDSNNCIKEFCILYHNAPLQFLSYVKIANSLKTVNDIDSLPIPEHLKEKLRSKPMVDLIGIHSSTSEE